VDTFQLVPGAACAGHGLSIDSSQSTLLVVGGARTNGNSGGELAVTRRSLDLGQTWQTTSAYDCPGSAITYWAGAANYGNTFYAVGTDNSAGWLVAQSTDGGATWLPSDSFQLAPGQSSDGLGVAVDGSGNVYATGDAYPTTKTEDFVIRELDTATGAWRTVYQGQGGRGLAIAIHPNGGVFVIGSQPYKRSSAWVVLRSTDGGGSWSIADLYPGSASGYSEGYGIAVDAGGNIYATGRSGSTWVTRKSTNGGVTWSTTDTFQSGQCCGMGVGFDYKSDVYVAGWSLVNNSYHWIVRMLPSGTSSWQTSDDFQLAVGETARPVLNQACILSADSGHVLLVTGYADGASGLSNWVTRRLVVP
jgi:hypothetical protein